MSRAKHEEARRLATLREIEVFATCSDEELRSIDSMLTFTRLRAGTKLTVSEQGGLDCLIVVEGRAVVRDGTGTIVATLGPGQIIGEMALLFDEPRSATVVAETDLQAYVLNIGEFRHLMSIAPCVREKILAVARARGKKEEPAQP